MKTRILLAAALLAIGPMTANAVPVLYETVYTATTGSNGTGSFYFDADAGTITGFNWDFGAGVTGGIADGVYGASEVHGDTIGRFAFELLGETDVHAGTDCINVACTVTRSFVGTAPAGALNFVLRGTPAIGSSEYRFLGLDNIFVASGAISIARAAAGVPEPGSLVLLAAGLFGLAFASRRRRLPVR